MDLVELINHPEQMDRDTLYELRSQLALHPYFQTVRLLMLQNLYLLHDPAFDEELRRAAIYITDRRKLFNLVEAAHYQLRNTAQNQQPAANSTDENRTMALIDTFLDSIPAEEPEEKKAKRRPTPKDATVDYVAYLLESEDNDLNENTPQMQGQDLIDHFLQEEQGRILLNELKDEEENVEAPAIEEEPAEEEYFTETLARIYIKQGRYQKALEIIQRLSNNFPEKNAYFADQIRFLEKLIINNNNMYTLFVILIVIAAILMIGIVLIQESKGGGLSSSFANYNQIGGVRKTTDFVEKATWGLALAMVLFSVVCAWVAPTATTDNSVMENYQAPATNPNNLPGFGASQTKDAAAPAKDAAAPAKDAAAPAAPADAPKAPAQPAK